MSVVFALKLKKHRDAQNNFLSSQDNGLFLEGKNGTCLILIHGLTGTPHEMKFLATSLHSKGGYTVIVPRLANHGAPLEVLKKSRWQDFYATVREVFLEASQKYDRIFVSGLSMGALLSLLLAQEFPDRVSGVSCLSPTLFYDGWNTPRYSFLLPLVYQTPLRHFFYFKEEPPYGLKNEAMRRFVDKYYSQAKLDMMENVDMVGYPFFPITLLGQLQLLVKHLCARLSSIETPVQLIQASEDDMTSVKNSQFIYDRIKSVNKELVLLYDSYHLVNADQERHKVVEKMNDFFLKVMLFDKKESMSHV
jgi:carboxylesterase